MINMLELVISVSQLAVSSSEPAHPDYRGDVLVFLKPEFLGLNATGNSGIRKQEVSSEAGCVR